MGKQLIIEMLAPEQMMVFTPQPPNGVRVSGLQSDPRNGPAGDIAVLFVVTVAANVTAQILANYLWDKLKNYSPKSFRLCGKQPKDKADFYRIVQEELEIGKND